MKYFVNKMVGFSTQPLKPAPFNGTACIYKTHSPVSLTFPQTVIVTRTPITDCFLFALFTALRCLLHSVCSSNGVVRVPLCRFVCFLPIIPPTSSLLFRTSARPPRQMHSSILLAAQNLATKFSLLSQVGRATASAAQQQRSSFHTSKMVQIKVSVVTPFRSQSVLICYLTFRHIT